MRQKITILFLLYSQFLFGQPAWLNDSVRTNNYNYSNFYSGFITKIFDEKTDINQEILKLREESLLVLLNSIYSKVNSETENISTEVNYKFTNKFYTKVSISSELDIPGVQTETYFDKNTRTGYSFSFVKKKEIADYYTNRHKEQLLFFKNIYEPLILSLPNDITSFVQLEKAFNVLTDIEKTREVLMNIGLFNQNNEIKTDNYLIIFNEKLNNLISKYISGLAITTLNYQITVPSRDSIISIPMKVTKNSKNIASALVDIPIVSSCKEYSEMNIRTNDDGIANFHYHKIRGVDSLTFSYRINSIEYLNISDTCLFFKRFLLNYFQSHTRVDVICERPIIYFSFQEKIQNEINTNPVIEAMVKETLSNSLVKFTKNASEADYEIKIQATCRHGSAYQSVFVAYAMATISVLDLKTGMEFYSKGFSEKRGLGSSYEQASIKSLVDLGKLINTALYETIENL